ncbi:MAG: potassium channel family protein [Candidatus Odinarchaeia archaeon]
MKIKYELKLIGILVIILVAMAFSGTLIFSYTEGWSLFDSFYFTMVTMIAIGYGDLAPITPIGKVTSIFLGAIGIIVFFIIIALIVRVILYKVKQKEREELIREIKSKQQVYFS